MATVDQLRGIKDASQQAGQQGQRKGQRPLPKPKLTPGGGSNKGGQDNTMLISVFVGIALLGGGICYYQKTQSDKDRAHMEQVEAKNAANRRATQESREKAAAAKAAADQAKAERRAAVAKAQEEKAAADKAKQAASAAPAEAPAES